MLTFLYILDICLISKKVDNETQKKIARALHFLWWYNVKICVFLRKRKGACYLTNTLLIVITLVVVHKGQNFPLSRTSYVMSYLSKAFYARFGLNYHRMSACLRGCSTECVYRYANHHENLACLSCLSLWLD